jgi:hypothetical protein
MSVYSNPLGEFARAIPIQSGANLDMTKFSSTMWIDSQHTRWDNGYPRKMGGRQLVDFGNDSIARAIYVNIVDDNRRYILMKDNSIIQIDVNPEGNITAIRNRTPVGWELPEAGNNYNYSFTEFSRTTTNDGIIASLVFFFFVPLENAKNPLTNKEKQIYFGRIDQDTPFIPYEAFVADNPTQKPVKTSGGVIESTQRLIIYGNGGLIYYTEVNNFDVIPIANISAGGSLKILAARPYRGSILFWSPEVLFGGTFTSLGLNLERLTSMTIVSPTSIIDGRNSTYYWMGLNQMYAFNGALQTFQNDNNRNYLYEKLNRNYLGNCWGMFLESFTELAWFVPQNDDKEASLCIIHNMEEKTWYKTILNRSCGLTTGVAPYPVMGDNQFLPGFLQNNYPIWYEDKGLNQVIEGIAYPIEAWVESNMFRTYLDSVQANLAVVLRRLEKNINQIGDMYLEVKYYNYPDSEASTLDPIVFQPSTTNINFSLESSIFSFKFVSNTIDGFYQFGPLVINYQNGNARPTVSFTGE